MAVAVAEAAAKGLDLREPGALDVVADGFQRWYADGHKGIGRQTRAVLRASSTGGLL
jgi:ADP-ribosyl-[dinitrogen reductase] hydrolase